MIATASHRSPVLVGVDRMGSPAAVQYAALEALRSARPLHVLHVVPTGDGWHAKIGHDALRAAVNRARSLLSTPGAVTGSLVRGNVVAELTAAAADAAMLVLERLQASQQRVPTTRTTAALAAAVDAPILVVPGDWVDDHRNVVSLGLEPTAVDEHAVRSALTLARLRGAVLRVVVCGDTPRSRVLDLLDDLGGDACDIAVEVVADPPPVALARAASASDLLVLGRRRPDLHGGSRLGPVSGAVLDDLGCPVLLTPPGHVHESGSVGPRTRDELTIQEVSPMNARPGDRIVIRSGLLGSPVRDGEVLEVGHDDGSPPYRVRWSDDGHVSLFFPGPDAYVDHPTVATA